MGKILRRTFLIGLGAVAGGLAVGYYTYRQPHDNPLEARDADGDAVFNPWIVLDSEGQFHVIVPRAEMGQAVTTTLTALVAEELGLPLASLAVDHGPASSAYYNEAAIEEGGPFPVFAEGFAAETFRSVGQVMAKFLGLQITGASTSVRDAFDKMRHAGAAARYALIAAAADQTGQPRDQLQMTPEGVSAPDGTVIAFADLVSDAAGVDIPESLPLKDPSEWTILGQSQKRVDMMDKVTGAPIYGVDVTLPDMLFGTVRMSPRLGAEIARADTTAVEAMPGVRQIIRLKTQTGNGFGVIADNSWAAFKAAEAIDVEWGEAPYPADTESQMTLLRDIAAGGPSGSAYRNDGDADLAFADAPVDDVLTADYEVPFLAHTAMEPMNATAQFADGRLTIWAPNQAPTLIKQICASATGLSGDDVDVQTLALGGGFGRRAEVDFALYAALMAMETDGRPVKVIWTREEDTTHDLYRPAAAGRLRARVNADGTVDAIDMRVATPSIIQSVGARLFPSLPMGGPERLLTEGAFDQPYTIPNYRVEGIATDVGVPVGFWRSVGYSFNSFFHECFLDEIAQRADEDPIALRRRLMADYPTAVGVMDRLAELSNWSAPVPAGSARGVAFCLSFGSWVGQVVYVSNSSNGVRLEKVFIVADVGRALDPAIIHDQLVSGAIYGLSSVLGQEVTFEDGMVVQQNFYDYDAMRMRQCPEFETAILETATRIGGVGEIGTPPVIPALVNAVSRLNGTRYRRLPLSAEVVFA